MHRTFAALLIILSTSVSSAEALDSKRLERIDACVESSLKRGDCPGAVVLVAQGNDVIYRKAFGRLALHPEEKPLDEQAVYDLASLTKPIATATSIWLLVEQGKLRPTDKVAKYWPEFGENKKNEVTIEHLLLHTSGLTADNALADYKEGKQKALAKIAALPLESLPGARFHYSDVGYIVLGELIERISGESIDAFSRKHIFEPLKMSSTGYLPKGRIKERCAPTAKREGNWLVGDVHDPRAALLGGVAGHAGLFGSADDLARFARMLLQGGELDGVRVLAPLTVRRMTEPVSVPGGYRSRGWDVDTAFSSPRGDLFARGQGYGHTGFTGTSIWIDPESRTTIIILTNRVHISEKISLSRLRSEVANVVASALTDSPISPQQRDLRDVKFGIDVLVNERFARLKGRKIGLVTNQTGLDRTGRSTIDLFHQAEGLKLVALFSPEHGIRGKLDQPNIGDTKDDKTGLPVYSLYGKRRKPETETLQGIDTLVYDIQDVGCRFYTYISTLGLVLEAASEQKLKVVILDRPNPIGGIGVEGPVSDPGRESFISFHPIPIRHGMTVGELAKLFVAERKWTVDLEVVQVTGWRRRDYYDRTGFPWTNPSPNMRSLTAAYLYPGIGLLETTNVSVGRGTDRPFEWVGAPWLDGLKLAAAMNRHNLPGVRFVPMSLTPAASVHQGKFCSGIHIILDDWRRFQPIRTGLTLAIELRKLHPDDWQIKNYDRLLVHKATFDGVQEGKSFNDLEKGWRTDLQSFIKRRKSFLLYDD